ncbi:MAG: MarR family winged helix-turn-helix transcriptional regulator [Pseudomonadota bacterium]
MADGAANGGGRKDLSAIFDALEHPDVYMISYLANAMVIPFYDRLKREHGLSRGEYLLLLGLSHFPELTAQDVARMSRRPRNTISRAVHRMVAEGCIARAPDPGDGRQARLTITPKGRALFETVAGLIGEGQERALGGLDSEERARLRALLRKAARSAPD